ncbi:MFS transporter [Nodosilinea sp. PGN35]|uniref:MFS transporter n=1 Tax=Nodosilinea sp. PGN35 TaxID=3020489 RepID=UPI0023B3105A|nr:MFS transporter [Nodosilinea sp. TSF1-S3]MDF0366527.1 MFS transporter [Nodosilinea sp. TSF1-S3]
MRTFITLWLGQLASSIGSAMTYFALTLWVWERTQSATAIALILVFYQLPQLAIALVSGLLVDRVSRKGLLIFSDIGSAICTISVGILAALHLLQVWHIYAIAAIIGCFGNVQSLTYATLIPLIVPPAHHSRASSLAAMIDFGAAILSPALAGLLYPLVGLLGITAVDMTTFAIALVTLLLVPIPAAQLPEPPDENPTERTTLWHRVTFGFRYIAAQPNLVALVVALSAFTFLHQIGEALYQPMILARTGGDAQVLGLVVAASGMGGVVGAIAFSLWNGFQRREVGILVGFMGTGASKLLLGMGSFPSLWAVARFGTSFHNPLILSSYMAVWYARVPPERQGRVLAADYLIGTVAMVLANLAAGPLADGVFEPWMANSSHHLSVIFGAGPGSGMALLQVVLAVGMLTLGLGGLGWERMRQRAGYRV